MYRVCLFLLIILSVVVAHPAAAAPSTASFEASSPDPILLKRVEIPTLTLLDRVGQANAGRPAWTQSFWGTLLVLALVIAFIFGGAYGIHLYQMRNLHKQTDRLEHVVSLRTEEVKRMNDAHKEVIDALVAANDALMDTNQLLEGANEKLAWTNTQLSHKHRELELRSAELNFSLEQNREILQVTVHDLKNPLGGVVGLAEVVQEDLARFADYDQVADIQESLGLIHQAAQHMLLNVEALLDRHSHNVQGPLHREEVFLNDIIMTTLQWNRQQAKNKALKFYFSGRHEKIAVNVYVSAMRRVMDNLISNAIKYSSMHGKIWIELLKQEDEVWVSVRDQGPGLTDEDVQRVFGKAERLTAKPTAGEHSSGYGLYIVKNLVEQHGGQVGVESVLGEGAAFWFKIDAVRDSVSDEQDLLMSI